MDHGGAEPSERDVYLDRLRTAAVCAFGAERFAAVVELLSAYLRHRPGKSWDWFMQGRSLRMLGLYQEAERALQTGEAMDGKRRPQFLAELGMVHNAAGDYGRAEACYAGAVEGIGMGDWLWMFRGANLADANQFAAALACYRHALTLDETEHAEAWLNIGYVLRAQGKYAEAIDALGRAIELEPGYPEAIEALATLDGIGEATDLLRASP